MDELRREIVDLKGQLADSTRTVAVQGAVIARLSRVGIRFERAGRMFKGAAEEIFTAVTDITEGGDYIG